MVKYCKSGTKRRRKGGKRKKSAKKTGSKRRRAPCRKIDTSVAGWYGESLIDGKNADDCKLFKTDLIPCSYQPSDRVHAYASACKIKGRSSMSKAQLCAALARKHHKRAQSKQCQLRHLAQIYAARAADPDYADPSYYSAQAMHQILKAACIPVPKNARREVMRDLIVRCVGAMEQEKQNHSQILAEVKLQKERELLDLKDPRRAVKATYKDRVDINERYNTLVKSETARHKDTMKRLMECGKQQAATGVPQPMPEEGKHAPHMAHMEAQIAAREQQNKQMEEQIRTLREQLKKEEARKQRIKSSVERLGGFNPVMAAAAGAR